ncbi:hypothetical protein [Lysinibacillus parviboronicapiens]|uniref:hypothetical protein n=1 Tax=Lysinibacillus parviboronicapiens TaxID=436516 RepID=UPI000D35A476|nr:hypothetical protein [Lysinibacillus parviboronicapiens]
MQEKSELSMIKIGVKARNIKLTNADLLVGSAIPPIERLRIVSPEEIEFITEEWAVFYLNK